MVPIKNERIPYAIAEMLNRMDIIEDNISFLVMTAKNERKLQREKKKIISKTASTPPKKKEEANG